MPRFVPNALRHFALLIASLLLTPTVWAFQAGWRQMSIPGPNPQSPATAVALYYPTQAAARAIPMGPFAPRVAPGGVPEATVKGLILLSHGIGGSELGHSRLAEALAENGYLVAALRHPGDNWQDQSLLREAPGAYFAERPRQVSRVIDALLSDPQWEDRIARDANGPRLGAVGHSAGGYTVLALAGGQPDVARIAKHCGVEAANDPIFCGMERTGQPVPAAGATTHAATVTSAAPLRAPLLDVRVRAVVALAPVGVVLTAQSLGNIKVPVALYAADQDRWLVPRFHADWIAQNLAPARMHQVHRVPNAWHFAFMDTPSMPIPTPDGDIGADPVGFDRAAFLQRLARELPAFFDGVFR